MRRPGNSISRHAVEIDVGLPREGKWDIYVQWGLSWGVENVGHGLIAVHLINLCFEVGH